MVIRPVTEPATTDGPVPVWPAIAARQKAKDGAYWLVAQPDHAQLAGDLAARFASPVYGELSPQAVRGIGFHDMGWGVFPFESDTTTQPLTLEDGKPRSFIEFAARDFTRAWRASIERAEQDSALGGCIVSRHFTVLGEFTVGRQHDAEDDRILREFLASEYERQRRLCPEDDVDGLLNVLQFCDLLSLALCCHAGEWLQFPQQFGGKKVEMRFRDGCFELTPSPFAELVSLGVPARRYPTNGATQTTTFAFLLR